MLWEGSRDGLGLTSSLQEPRTARARLPFCTAQPELGHRRQGEGAGWRAVVRAVIPVVVTWDGVPQWTGGGTAPC